MSKKKLKIENREVTVERSQGMEWFNLNELAKQFGKNNPTESIRSWMKKTDTLNYLDAYEQIYNPDFNADEMTKFIRQAIKNNTKVSTEQYVKSTNAKFLRTSRGRNGGTFANFDVATHFMMWLSSVFQIWFVRDYRRMKEAEYEQELRLEKFYAQKNVDNLMESLRNEQDRLEILQKKAKEIDRKE